MNGLKGDAQSQGDSLRVTGDCKRQPSCCDAVSDTLSIAKRITADECRSAIVARDDVGRHGSKARSFLNFSKP